MVETDTGSGNADAGKRHKNHRRRKRLIVDWRCGREVERGGERERRRERDREGEKGITPPRGKKHCRSRRLLRRWQKRDASLGKDTAAERKATCLPHEQAVRGRGKTRKTKDKRREQKNKRRDENRAEMGKPTMTRMKRDGEKRGKLGNAANTQHKQRVYFFRRRVAT